MIHSYPEPEYDVYGIHINSRKQQQTVRFEKKEPFYTVLFEKFTAFLYDSWHGRCMWHNLTRQRQWRKTILKVLSNGFLVRSQAGEGVLRRFNCGLPYGQVKNRAPLARREGVTRARVTQIMKLLLLAPDIQEAILALPVGTPERLVTERKLRNLVDLAPEKQRARFEAMASAVRGRAAADRRAG